MEFFWQEWHPNPSLTHGGRDAQGFQRTSYNASTPYREPTWRIANDGGSDRETPDSRYVDQPFDDFLFPWEDRFVNNPITIEEDEGFSGPKTPVSESPIEPPLMESSPALRFIENLQTFEISAARQLFDL